MQIRIGKRVLYEGSWKRILYALCFCFLCVIDQRVMTCYANGGGRELFRDLTGIVIAVIILSHYRWQNIVKYKKIYIDWSILAAIGLPVLFAVGRSRVPFLADWIVVILDFFVWGYVLVATGISCFIEKKRPKWNKKIVTVWLVMMFLMIVSRSNLWWPVCYLVMFGCFYLTDFDEAEREDLFRGALNGVILAFFLFQGLCFLYRPYDAVRYVGWYTNCNINALFYLSVLSAVLTKLYLARRAENTRWQRIYYFLGVGTVLAFIFMTIGRAAWITSFVMVIFALFFMCRKKGKKVYILNGLAIILCACLMFPVCFAALRYLPALRHHPVWFDGEWNEWKVHSWDPMDSEKYVEMDELLGAATGRIGESIEDLLNHILPVLRVRAAEEVKQPVIADGEPYDAVIIRGNIYRHFWSELNLRGHREDEIGLQLRSNYWVGHAHNIFLQFGTNFGIPVMILFAVLILWPLMLCTGKWKKQGDAKFIGSFFQLLIPLLFGMFEYCWGAGSLTIFMIFFSWRNVIWEKE